MKATEANLLSFHILFDTKGRLVTETSGLPIAEASKVFKVHSIPAHATSSAAIRSGEVSQIGVLKNGVGSTWADGETLGTGTTDLVYHANSEMIAGDTDIFYYKTTDGQSTPVDSSTTQGIVTVTIV